MNYLVLILVLNFVLVIVFFYLLFIVLHLVLILFFSIFLYYCCTNSCHYLLNLQLQLFVAYAVHEVIEPQLASVVAEAHQTSSLVSRASHQSCPIELMSSLVANGDHFHRYSLIISTSILSSFSPL